MTGQDWLIIADKGYVSREFDAYLAERGARLPRPSHRNRIPHPTQHLLKPVRQLIKSVNQTLKGQPDLELHNGHTTNGVTAHIAQRPLATICHNRTTDQPTTDH